jgi:hypothetical protein
MSSLIATKVPLSESRSLRKLLAVLGAACNPIKVLFNHQNAVDRLPDEAENPDRTSDASNSANDFHSIILDDGGKVHSSKMLGKFRTLTFIAKIEC